MTDNETTSSSSSSPDNDPSSKVSRYTKTFQTISKKDSLSSRSDSLSDKKIEKKSSVKSLHKEMQQYSKLNTESSLSSKYTDSSDVEQKEKN